MIPFKIKTWTIPQHPGFTYTWSKKIKAGGEKPQIQGGYLLHEGMRRFLFAEFYKTWKVFMSIFKWFFSAFYMCKILSKKGEKKTTKNTRQVTLLEIIYLPLQDFQSVTPDIWLQCLMRLFVLRFMIVKQTHTWHGQQETRAAKTNHKD